MKKCSKCGRELEDCCFGKCRKDKSGLQSVCKECYKIYYQKNKDKIIERSRNYYYDNKEHVLENVHKYNDNNSEIIKAKDKIYRKSNKEEIAASKKAYNNSMALYETYYDRLTVNEMPEIADDGIHMTVLCNYCGRRFIPTVSQVSARICALYGQISGESNIFCSSFCQACCPIFGQKKYPKGFKPASSREVLPDLRKMVLECDNWTCQKCGKTVEDGAELHCHHINPVSMEPMLSADLENCVTLCKQCHQEVHKMPGCGYSELRCSNDEKIKAEYEASKEEYLKIDEEGVSNEG